MNFCHSVHIVPVQPHRPGGGWGTGWRVGIGAMLAASAAMAGEALRAPVHPRRNIEEFAAVEARFIRFSIQSTNRGEPCLDELEVYGPDDPAKNLALTDAGPSVRASGSLSDYRIHALRHLNDGLYGNAHSWIGNAVTGWVELEFPQVTRISRIVWSRDRLGKFTDRLATRYRIESALEPGQWQVVASSDDRKPLEASVMNFPSFRAGNEGFAPWSGEAAGPAGPAAREYVLATWRSEQGLPANSVTAIVQTPDRWLWVGTMNGLVRFDGVQFTAPGTDALKGQRITCLHCDGHGTLWAGTDGAGLVRAVDGRFVPLPAAAGLPERSVLALGEDAGGTLWAGTAGGLYALRDGTFSRKETGMVTRIVRDGTGDGIWFIRDLRLLRWSAGAVRAPGPATEPSQFGSMVALASDAAGAVWFGGANEYFAKLDGGGVTTFAEGHSIFTTALREILPARHGDIWLGTAGSGLARMRDGQLLTLGPDDGLPSNSIEALCEDAEGNLWVGGGDGLTRLSPRRCAAVTVNDGLSHSVVMSLAEEASGRLWLGTNGGGINRWEGGRAEPLASSFVLDNEIIPALLADAHGTMWAGTMQNGLARIDGEKISFLTTVHGLPENAVTALCEDAAGGIWTGSPNGGAAYVREGKVIQPPAVAPLKGSRLTAIVSDRGHRVWFGTAGQGVARLDGETLTRWTVDDGLAGNSIRTLGLDADGQLWVGTSAGLSRWRDPRFESFTVRHGLPDEVVSQIVDDGTGNLWLGTNRGVIRVPHRSFDDVSAGRSGVLDVMPLDKGDGLPALECTGGFHPSGLRLRDGRLGFGTVAGLALVDPTRFATPSAPPPVIIEDIAFGTGAPFSPDQSGAFAPVGTRSAKLRFTALAFTAPQRVRFRYRMEGLQAGWTLARAERAATYDFLPPGSFRFQVQASLDSGPWSEAGVALHVPAPWWQSRWVTGGAVLGSVAAVAGAVRFITRRRLKRRLRSVEQKLALERERARIARDIHDQLGANLTHIAMLSAGDHDALPPVVQQRFHAIAASSNELVQAVDAIVWAVNPRHGTLESLARYVSRVAGDFLFAAGVRLRLDVPVDLPEAELSPELRHSIFLAAREVLNNCVRHAGATEVHLSLRASPKAFVMVIADNGCGFVRSAPSGGDGLENMGRRLAECGGTCDIASVPGRGTTVTFTIPLGVYL